MKFVTILRIAVSALMLVVLGCATFGSKKYVGAWLGSSAKAKHGVNVRLDDGGVGYAMTYIGAVPLKWRETDANRLDVRFSCGDGSLFFYDMSYSPEDRTLRLVHEKRVRFRDGRVSGERSFDDMILCRSNEYAKAMAPAIEYAEKVKDFHDKSERERNQGMPEMETNCMVFASWDEVGQICKPLQDGWTVSLSSVSCPKPSVFIDPRGQDGRIEVKILGGQFVIGDPNDKCDFEVARRHNVLSPVEAVPSNATPIPGLSWDATIEADTLRRVRDKGWKVGRAVYCNEHFFYATYHTHYTIQTGDMSVEEVVGSLRDCFGEAMKPPLKASMRKIKTQ